MSYRIVLKSHILRLLPVLEMQYLVFVLEATVLAAMWTFLQIWFTTALTQQTTSLVLDPRQSVQVRF